MTDFHMICLGLLSFLLVLIVWLFNDYALSRQLVMKTKQMGIGNSIRMYVSHVLSTKTGPQTCVNWLIRYIMQDVGLKYLHL